MFEYTALVDAPVQRFTSIVTGPDPDDEPVTQATRMVPLAVAAPDVPVTLIAVVPKADPEMIELAPAAVPVAAPRPPVTVAPIAPAARPPVRFVPTTPSREPSLVPALLAVAAAGITAMWWLRRDSHDR